MTQEESAEGPKNLLDDLKPGTKLLRDQYVIQKFINSGGFGITYLALDSLDRDVVIKECFPGSICRRTPAGVRPRARTLEREYAKIVRLFVQEAKRLSTLKHPNIVAVHQVFEDNGTAYIAMDFINGRDLQEVIEGAADSLTPTRLVEMLKKLLHAISYIHENGLLHRDISPDNVLIDKSGEPILIDFGAARQQATAIGGRALSAIRIVKEGYSPQEFYVEGSIQAPASDLYALAASFYHAVSGAAPPGAQERLVAIAESAKDPCVPLEGRFEGYPDGFLAAIDKALKVLPKDRIQSARDWLSLIEKRPDLKVIPIDRAGKDDPPAKHVKLGKSHGQPVAETATPGPNKPSSKTLMMAGAAAAVLALIGGGAFLLMGDGAAVPEAETAEVVVEPAVPASAPEAPVESASSEPAASDAAPEVASAPPPDPEPASEGQDVAVTTLEPATSDTQLASAEGVSGAEAEDPLAAAFIMAASNQDPTVTDGQIRAETWIFDLPFETVSTGRPGSFPTVSAVMDVAASAPEHAWIKTDVIIYAVNGEWVSNQAEIEARLQSAAAVADRQDLRAAIRIKEAPSAPFLEVALILPVVQQLDLVNGISFRSEVIEGTWTTRVTAVTEPTQGGLQPGDIIFAERVTGLTVGATTPIELVIGDLAEARNPVAVFRIDRAGESLMATMPLAKGN